MNKITIKQDQGAIISPWTLLDRDVFSAPVLYFNVKFQASQEKSLESCGSFGDVFFEDLFKCWVDSLNQGMPA